MGWTLTIDNISIPKNPDALRDVRPLLQRLASAFGGRPLARFLGVGSGTVSNWLSGQRTMNPEMTARVIDLHDVLTRALQVYAPEVVIDWLLGNDPYLDHKRPIDVLALHGAGPLIQALDAHESFGYA